MTKLKALERENRALRGGRVRHAGMDGLVLEAVGNILRAEAEDRYYATLEHPAVTA